MKKCVSLAISLLLAASFGYSQKIAIKFGGSLAYSSAGDIASGLRDMTNYLRAEFPGSSGEFSAPHASPGFAGEIIYYFKTNVGLGVSFGIFGMSKEGTIAYSADILSAKETLKPKAQVIPIALSLHYVVPLSNAFRLDFNGGFGGYLANVDWNYRADFTLTLPDDPGQVFDGSDILAFESGRRFGFGLHGGIGLEYALSPGLSVVLDLAGRLASVSGFNGSWTETGSGDFWDFSDSGTDAYLWTYDWNVNNATYSQIVLQKETPSGATVSNARHAKLGLSGFSATIGIKIGLGR